MFMWKQNQNNGKQLKLLKNVFEGFFDDNEMEYSLLQGGPMCVGGRL